MIPKYEQIARACHSGRPLRLRVSRGYILRVMRDVSHARSWIRAYPAYDPTKDDEVVGRFDDQIDRERRVSRAYAITIFRVVIRGERMQRATEAEPVVLKFPGVA